MARESNPPMSRLPPGPRFTSAFHRDVRRLQDRAAALVAQARSPAQCDALADVLLVLLDILDDGQGSEAVNRLRLDQVEARVGQLEQAMGRPGPKA